ncbi:MAG: UPF0104 family protein [Alphaproteobacteria bacterium]|nr:UPF0104 family protein [Alphaproteobacteria bacterium]
MKHIFDRIIQVVGLAIFAFALFIIAQEVHKVGLHHLIALVLTTPWWIIGAVFIVLGADYLVLSGYDILALKYLKKKLPYSLIFKASSVGFAIGNTVGHSSISGGALRYFFYLKHGLSRTNIVMLITFETVMFCLGLMVTYCVAIALLPSAHLQLSKIHLYLLYLSGVLVLLCLIFYGSCVCKFHKKLCIFKTHIATPTPKSTIAQVIISCMDNLLLNIVFFILLRYHLDIDFVTSFVACVLAMTIGMCMQSPGGLGIFEGLILLLLPHTPHESAAILASLILFRVLYFFVPFILGCLYFIPYWICDKKKSPH